MAWSFERKVVVSVSALVAFVFSGAMWFASTLPDPCHRFRHQFMVTCLEHQPLEQCQINAAHEFGDCSE